MKRILYVLALLCGMIYSCFFANAQEQRFYYVEVTEASIAGIITVSVDFGLNAPAGMSYKISDENGHNINFKNVVAAINYLSRQGWEVLTVYERDLAKSGTRAVYLLKFDAEAHPKTALVKAIDDALKEY